MNFAQFQDTIHQKGFLILVLNDYQQDNKIHTFVAVQDKLDHGFHAEGPKDKLDLVYQGLIDKINNI